MLRLTIASIAALLCIGSCARAQTRPRIEYTDIWRVAGVVEEMRNAGAAIPDEAERIIDEALRKRNFSVYVRGEWPAKRDRLRELLEALPVPSAAEAVYRDPREKILRQESKLPPFRASNFLTDRLLGVGLKSYPYVVDFDANGTQDLLVGDHDGLIYVYLNEGSNAQPKFGKAFKLLAADTQRPLIVQPNPKLSFGDLTGDGAMDLLVGNYGGKVGFLTNLSQTGGWEFAVKNVRFLQTASGPIDVGFYAYPQLHDWNDDGALDAVIGNIDGELRVYRNDTVRGHGKVVFTEAGQIEGIEKLMYPYPIFHDWNADGRDDLILGHREGTLLIYLNDAPKERPPKFISAGVAAHADGSPVDAGVLSHPFIADFNDDGKFDLVVGNDPGQILVFYNVGAAGRPVFGPAVQLHDGGGELIAGVHSVFTVADFTGDGACDLMVGQTEDLRFFANTGTPENPDFNDYRVLTAIDMSAKTRAARDPETAAHWNRGGLQFSTEYLGDVAPAACDWDGDGLNDLVVGSYSGLFYLFRNVGTKGEMKFDEGTLLRMRDGTPLRTAAFSSPVMRDFNADGVEDIISGDLLGRIHVFLRDPSDPNVFAKHMRIHVSDVTVELGPRSIVDFADISGDGRADLVVGNRTGDVFALLNVSDDVSRPRFDHVIRLQDDSPLWRQLYDGYQYAASDGLRARYESLPEADKPRPMNTVETSCPRVADIASAQPGNELLVSSRYGRVYVYPMKRSD